MMSTSDRSTARVVASVVLVAVAAVALRGTPPGGRRPADEHAVIGDTAALILTVALVGVSLAIVAVAVVARLRDPRASASVAGRSDWFSGRGSWPRWRTIAVVAGLTLGALFLAMLLVRLGLPGAEEPPQPAPTPESADPATGTPSAPPPSLPADSPANEAALRTLSVAAVCFVVLVAAGAVVAMRRHRPTQAVEQSLGSGEPPPQLDAADTLARAAEAGLAEVGDLSREPRAAIIACYAAMEHELARVPGAAPQVFDTASEVLARAVEHDALRSGSASHLVELFEEARFSPHQMDEGHRDSAVAALELVRAELGEVAEKA